VVRDIVASVYLGLGGSFLGRVLSASTYYKFWAMRIMSNGSSIEQTNDALGSPPTGWSSGDSLTMFGDPLVNQPSLLPEGGSAVRLNGTSQYMASAYDETADLADIGPQSLQVALVIHAVPGAGVEPSVAGGSTEFAITARSDGRIYGYYNGAAVVNLPFTVGASTHIVLTRSDGAPDSIKLYVNGAVDSATPANGTINRGYFHAGKHWTNPHYLSATYSLIAFHATELSAVQVAALFAATAWTDVSADVQISPSIVTERGIRDDSPIARVAATGFATFALDNSERNSTGLLGYYTPGHVNCRAGFQKGIPCRVTMSVGATEYTQFVGRLRRIAPEPDEYGDRRTMITATDWMDEAARFRLAGVSILENVRQDEVFQALVLRMPNQPHGLTLHHGSETYDLALDNTRDEATPVLEEFVRLHASEVGRAYVSRIGTLVSESRYARASDYASVAADIDYKMLELDAAETSDTTVNRVQVTVHPRRVDALATTTLFTLERPIELNAGETQVFTATYVSVTPDGLAAERVGGLDMALATVSANELSTGEGTDRTAGLVVSVRFDANSAEVTATNTNSIIGSTSGSAAIFITALRLVGRGIYDFQPIPLIAEDSASIAADGVIAVSFDMGYQEDTGVGLTIARALLAAYQSERLRPRQVVVCANEEDLPDDLLALDVSDRIALNEYMTALDGEYHINGVRVEYSEGVKCDITWWLATTAEGDALMAWAGVTYNAANFTASAGTWTVDSGDQLEYRWVRSGPSTLQIRFRIATTDVSGSPVELRIAIPGGFVAQGPSSGNATVGYVSVTDAGVLSGGSIRVGHGDAFLRLLKENTAAWTNTTGDNTTVSGTATIEIQT
jgi:hypothetical protein